MIQPLGYKILIEIPKIKEKMAGMFYIPEEAKKKQQMGAEVGIIRAIGPLAFTDRYDETPVSVGQYVYFKKYAGQMPTNKSDRDLRIIMDDDLDGIAPEDEIAIEFELFTE